MTAEQNSDVQQGPLAGIRVVDLTSMISGPVATMMLADQGADVIKVEAFSGDYVRAGGHRSGGLSASFLNNNRNKRSIAINLKDGGKQACFSGDIMHHPIQVYHPDWSSQFCTDQALSAKSRRKLLENCVESNALLCPAHFPGANAGYINSERDSFRIEWDVVK